jgi:hypothetical protein
MVTTLLRPVAAALFATLVAAGTVLLVPASAYACSCVTASDVRHARWAEAVVVGTVVDAHGPPWWRLPRSSSDPVTYEVDVDRLFKGATGTSAAVRSAGSEASCGIDLEVGDRYLLFAQRDGEGELGVGLCDGTREATPAALERVEDILGPAYPPDASIPPPEGTGASVWPLGAGGLLVAGGVGLAAVGLVARHRRRVAGGDT